MLCILQACVSVASGSRIQGCIVNSRPTWATRASVSKTKQTKDSTGHLYLYSRVLKCQPCLLPTLPHSLGQLLPVLTCSTLTVVQQPLCARPLHTTSFKFLCLVPAARTHTLSPYTPLPSFPKFQGTDLSLPALFAPP